MKMSMTMDFDEVVKRRKMIREYDLEKQIPDEIITKLIKNAHKAPSAGHTQVQEFIIVKDSSIKKEVEKERRRFILSTFTIVHMGGIPLPFTAFLRILGIPTMINLFVTYFILKFYYRKELFLSSKLPNYHHYYHKRNDYRSKKPHDF